MVTRADMTAHTQKALIDAAIKLFARDGYADTSVGDIAVEAGVTKGAVYHHYAGKEELLLQIQQSTLDRVLSDLEVIARDSRSAADEIREQIKVQLRCLAENRDAFSLTTPERRPLAPEHWELIRAKRNRVEQYFIDAIVRGQKNGEFDAARKPRLVVYGILGMCYWGRTWFKADGPLSYEDIAWEFSNLVLNGLVSGQAAR